MPNKPRKNGVDEELTGQASKSAPKAATVKEQPVPLDVFITMDKIPAAPANGLRVHLSNKGAASSRTLGQWRNAYNDYMGMSAQS